MSEAENVAGKGANSGALLLAEAASPATVPADRRETASESDAQALARDPDTRLRITDGYLSLVGKYGTTVDLPNTSILVEAFRQEIWRLTEYLEKDRAALADVVAEAETGVPGDVFGRVISAIREIGEEFADDPSGTETSGDGEAGRSISDIGETFGLRIFSALGSGHHGIVFAFSLLGDETGRFGRDDLKRGEAGSAGQEITTATGSSLGHLTGLPDEEPGLRNGEKIASTDNFIVPPTLLGVGASLGHLWLLGDFEYYRSSTDHHNVDGMLPDVSRTTPVYGPLLAGSWSFWPVEDIPFVGQLFAPGVNVSAFNVSWSIDPQAGTLIVRPDGSFLYTPAPGYSGRTTFTFSLTDPRTGETVQGEVVLPVRAVADLPVIASSTTTLEDTLVPIPVTVTLGDTDGSETIERVIISGLPAGATLGFTPIAGAVVATDAFGNTLITGDTAAIQALLQTLTFDPPLHFSGEVTLGITVTIVESRADPTVPGFRDSVTLHHDDVITVVAVADEPLVTGDIDEVTPEDTRVRLDELSAALVDADGSEILTVEVSGVAPGARLENAGGAEYPFTLQPDGTRTYTIPPGDLANVFFDPPADAHGMFNMTITATATEQSNGDIATSSAAITVVVTPVEDLPTISGSSTTIEDQAVNFGSNIIIGPVVDADGSESITEVRISGIPAGAVPTGTGIGGATFNFDAASGTITVSGGTEQDIRGTVQTLSLTPPAHSDVNIALAVVVTTTDAGVVASTPPVPHTISVAADADAPAFSITGANAGPEDGNIPISFRVDHADSTDGSERIEEVRIAGVPAGFTLTHASTAGAALSFDAGSGVYIVTVPAAAGITSTLARDSAINDLLANLTLEIDPAGPRRDLDTNFDLEITATIAEVNLSGGEVATATATNLVPFRVPVTVTPVVDLPVITGSSVMNEDGILDASDQSVTAPFNFGANIAITENDKADASEAITAITVAGFPAGAVVTYTSPLGASVTHAVSIDGPSIVLSGGTEDQIRAALASMAIVPPQHSDADITLAITVVKSDGTATEPEASVTGSVTGTHVITVKAIADGPVFSASAAGVEDTDIPLRISSQLIDQDGSESYAVVRLTLPAGHQIGLPGTPFVDGVATPLPGGFTGLRTGNVYEFRPNGQSTSDFEAFLANTAGTGLTIRPPLDSNGDFDISVEIETTEQVTLPGDQVELLTKSETRTVTVEVASAVDAWAVSSTSSYNEDGILDPTQAQTPGNVAVFDVGARIAAGITRGETAPADASEAITEIRLDLTSGLPDLSGLNVTSNPDWSVTVAGSVVTITSPLADPVAAEAAIRAGLAAITLTPTAHADSNIVFSVAVTVKDTDPDHDANSATVTFNGTHTIQIAAVADAPTGSGSGAGFEDQTVSLSASVSHPDLDGSERIEEVVITGVPAGFVLTETSALGATLTANPDGSYTVTATGIADRAAHDSAINDLLANLHLEIDPLDNSRLHRDDDFSLTFTARTIEANPTEAGAGEVARLRNEVPFSVPVTITAVADPVTHSGQSVLVEDTARTIGSEIQYARVDGLPGDTSEYVTQVTITGFPVGATVTYEPIGGGGTIGFIATGAEIITLSGLHANGAADEAAIRAALDTLTVTPPPNSDLNFALTITATTTDNGGDTETTSWQHQVIVQAVADAPSVTASMAAMAEDASQLLVINANRSADEDNSETLSVRITVPSDGSGPVGTLTGSAPAGLTFQHQGGGVYLVTATGADPAAREALLDGFLGSGVTFTPRANWSGQLSGSNGILVEAISTEAATAYGNTTPAPDDELAPNTLTDPDTRIETATAFVAIDVAPVPDLPVMANASTIVRENNNSTEPADPDLVIAIGARLGLTIADTDGSESLRLVLSGFPTGPGMQAASFGVTRPGVVTSIDLATGTITIEGTTPSALADARDILAVVNSLSITLADDDDRDFTIAISGTARDSNGATTVDQPVSLTHTVVVQAVADRPGVTVPPGPIAAIDEDAGFVAYPISTALNDTDGSETMESVMVTFATPDDPSAAAPVFQFPVSAGVTFTPTSGGTILTGTLADINAALASLQIRPGADNGEDIHVTVTAVAVESNPSEANSNGPGSTGDQISIPTAQTTATFVIPVTPVPETPILTLGAATPGLEDGANAVVTIAVSVPGGLDADGSEAIFVDVRADSFPAGTVFRNAGGTAVGTSLTDADGTWLRIPQSELANLEVDAPLNWSGTMTLVTRGVVVDTAASGSVTAVTPTQNLTVQIRPVADPLSSSPSSTGIEDTGPVAFGARLASTTSGIRVQDAVVGGPGEGGAETLSRVMLTVPADIATLTYTMTGTHVPGSNGTFAGAGTAQVTFDSAARTYTITSTIITGAADVGALTDAQRAQAETDIRATLATFQVTIGPEHNDLDGVIAVTATALDVKDGIADTRDTTFNHTIRIQAVADVPTITAFAINPVVSEDAANIALAIDPGRSADEDGSETLSVRVTVPSDSLGPIGTLVGTPPAGITVTNPAPGVYLVETTVPGTPADKEAALDAFLNGGGLSFNPRDNWSGVADLTITAISTEAATAANQLAPNVAPHAGIDGSSRTEPASTTVQVTVLPVVDAPSVKGNAVGLEDTVIPVPISVTVADKDGSETYVMWIADDLPVGTELYGAGGVRILPQSDPISGNNFFMLTPADVAALALLPPLHWSSPLHPPQGDIILRTTTIVTDASGGASATASFQNDITVEIRGVADKPNDFPVTVAAEEDAPIALGQAVLAAAGATDIAGLLATVRVDADGSEGLSFVLSGLPPGVVPTSTTGTITYIGNDASGTRWQVSLDAIETLVLPPRPDFSGIDPHGGNIIVQAVTQEIDGDQATSDPWTVSIAVSPVIDEAGRVDGLTNWNPGVTVTEDNPISLAGVAVHDFVDTDGSETILSYVFDLSNVIANAGIATQLAGLPALNGETTELEKLVRSYMTGTFDFDPATGTITVDPADIAGVGFLPEPFLDSNRDFAIPVTARMVDTPTGGSSPPVQGDFASGSGFVVNFVGDADIPTVFANSVSGNANTLLPIILGGTTTDSDVAIGRPQSEEIYYIVTTRSLGGVGGYGFADAAGNVVGLDNGDGSWLLTPADLNDLRITTPPGSNGTLELTLTTVALENDGDLATNPADFTVTVTDTGGPGTFDNPLAPIVSVQPSGGNEDGPLTLLVAVTPAPGDTTNPTVSVMIGGLPPGSQVIGAAFNPITGRWVASATAVNDGDVRIIPPQDFAGELPFTIEAVARTTSLLTAATGVRPETAFVDPVADGASISLAASAGTEDVPLTLGIALGVRDTSVESLEQLGSSAYVRLDPGAILQNATGVAYAIVQAGDADATITARNPATGLIETTSLVGAFRVPSGEIATAQLIGPTHRHGDVGGTIYALTVESVSDPTPDADNQALTQHDFAVTLAAAADSPVVTAPGPFAADEDAVIPISGITAALVDTDGSEVLSLIIRNVPHGSLFNAGTNNGDGSWTIPADAATLAALTFTPPLHYGGVVELQVVAFSLETSNGDVAESLPATLRIDVTPRADSFEILAENVAIGGSADAALELNVRMADNRAAVAMPGGEVGAEVIEITFSGVPAGVGLTAASGGTISNPSAGTWIFTGTEAQANALSMSAGAGATSGTFTVALSAVTIDGGDRLATAVTDTFRITVPTVIAGTPGSDALSGGSGTQLIFGGAGDDSLSGGAGDDYLAGGQGTDTMTGGAGADTFAWSAGDLAGGGVDRITDFSGLQDLLDVSDLLSGYVAGTSDVTQFLSVPNAAGNTTVAVDVNGTGANYVDLVVLQGVTVSLNDLQTNGNLIV